MREIVRGRGRGAFRVLLVGRDRGEASLSLTLVSPIYNTLSLNTHGDLVNLRGGLIPKNIKEDLSIPVTWLSEASCAPAVSGRGR